MGTLPVVGERGVESEDGLSRVTSGLLAGAVLANLGAAGAIWWYRQAASGWAPPSPRVWRLLGLLAMVLAAVALVVAIIAVVRRSSGLGKAGAVAWALVAAGVLVGTPMLIQRLAPEGEHAVVVALDAETGDVRWRVETAGWSLRSLSITGDVVTVMTVGGDREPCQPAVRRLVLGLAEGTRLTVQPQAFAAPQPPPTDYVLKGGDLIRASGPSELWRVSLDPRGLFATKEMVLGRDVVIVAMDGRLPLTCHI